MPHQRSKPHAFNAQLDSEDDNDCSPSASESGSNSDEATACLCVNCASDEEYDDIEDAIEQDVLMAFLAANCDLNDKDVCEEIAECIHNEFTAFVAREQAHQRGVPLQRVVHQFRPPPSELTLEQRRAKIALAKKNSTCPI